MIAIGLNTRMVLEVWMESFGLVMRESNYFNEIKQTDYLAQKYSLKDNATTQLATPQSNIFVSGGQRETRLGHSKPLVLFSC